MSTKRADAKRKPVLVTTAHRGVFFGYMSGKPDKTVTLVRARCCIYWPAGTMGFLGLASDGPQKGSKIGPAVSTLTLYDVTSISAVEPAAVEAWEKAPWA